MNEIGPFATILRLLDLAKSQGYFTDYVLGGGVATLNYTEPFLTYDTGFVVDMTGSATMRELDDFFVKNGAIRNNRGYIEIDGMPCQFLSIGDDLIRDAFTNPNTVTVGGRQLHILKIEYLIANYLRLIRLPKRKKRDTAKLLLLLDQPGKIDSVLLSAILEKNNLGSDYRRFLERMDS